MSEIKPLKREELYLNRLAGVEEQPLPDKPLTREELYYNRLCGGANEIPDKPLTRKELFLAKLNGEEVVTPEPLNRIEQYMAFAAGETEDKPENPRTREEWYWDNYQGGAVPEEKTVSGNPIHVTDAVEESALVLSVAFEPTQAGTPFVGDTTNEPYLSKTASTTGNKRYLDKIVGGTVAWNQLVDTDTTSVTVLTGHKYIAKINGTWTSGNGGTVSVTGGTDMLIDLTLMFGRSDIADYIYSLEQAETGAGVQWLKDYGFIDENYRTYNPGELISCRPEGIRYGSTTHAFGSAVELRGLYKLDANNKLYCDGDELMPDGVVTTKFAEINLGDYTYSETVMSNNRKLFSTSYLNFPKTPYFNTNIPTPSICPIGIVTYMRASAWNVGEYVFASNSSIIPESKALGFIVDATKYADATAFKNAVSGIHLVYLTATPTTSASTPYTNPAPISNGDTEAFIDTRSIPLPVGNNSHYAGEYEIEGHESVTVYQAQTQDEPNPTEYEVEFTEQGTVYGGVIDIVTGALTITWGYIASYNGETLTGRWISSLDVYAEGTTPTTGAEVAYELASPITAELTPQQVDMLLGENTVWTDGNESITLTYMSKAAQRVLAMNRKLATNKAQLEIKKNGGVIIDKPVVKPISGGLKK